MTFLPQVAIENIILDLIEQVDNLKQILAHEKENSRKVQEQKLNESLVGSVFGGFTFLYKINSVHLKPDDTCQLTVNAILMSTLVNDSHIILKKNHVVEYDSVAHMEKERVSKLLDPDIFEYTWTKHNHIIESACRDNIEEVNNQK